MNRQHPVGPRYVHHDQQSQPHQPLDLRAGVIHQRQQQCDDNSRASRHCTRWSACMRHWQTIVCVIFALTLLLNAVGVIVVWSHWSTACFTAQPNCPAHHVVLYRLSSEDISVECSMVDRMGVRVPLAQEIIGLRILGERNEKRTVEWTSRLQHVLGRFQPHAVNVNLTVLHNGIYLVYSSVSFRSTQNKTEVFKHEIREAKGDNEGRLLHNVVEKHCRSPDGDAACHSSVLVSALWLKAGYNIYFTAEPKPLLNTSNAHFGVLLISQ